MSNDLMAEFKKRKRRWLIEIAFEFVFLVAFMVTYVTDGDTNSLIFYGVLFLWANSDAHKAYKRLMILTATNSKELGANK